MQNSIDQLFWEESQALLQILDTGLLALAQRHDIGLRHELTRASHTLMGGAAMVGLPRTAAIAKRLDDIFRDRLPLAEPFTPHQLQQLHQVCDGFKAAIHPQGTDPETAIQATEPILQQLEASLVTSDPSSGPIEKLPSLTDLGLDLVALLFASDVPAGLANLANCLQGSDAVARGEGVRSQLETFLGIGELTDLKGFIQISQTALTALSRHPDQSLQIGQLALQDYQTAAAAVTAGDRQIGGSPSYRLQRLATHQPAQTPSPKEYHGQSLAQPFPTVRIFNPTPTPTVYPDLSEIPTAILLTTLFNA